MEDALARITQAYLRSDTLKVLILVVMEDALALETKIGESKICYPVLILVVMEDALAPLCKALKLRALLS